MRQERSFESVWEGYLFKVASIIIDSASPAEQTRIIAAIGEGSLFTQPLPSIASEHRLVQDQALPQSPLAQLEDQWRMALLNPLSPVRRCLESKDVLVRGWFLLNQQQIVTAQSQIERLQGLLERVKQTSTKTPQQNTLVSHYERIEAGYTTYLAKLLVARDYKAARHTLLESSICLNQ